MKYKNIYEGFRFTKEYSHFNKVLKQAIETTRKVTLEETFEKIECLSIYIIEGETEIHSLQNDPKYLRLKAQLLEDSKN